MDNSIQFFIFVIVIGFIWLLLLLLLLLPSFDKGIITPQGDSELWSVMEFSRAISRVNMGLV
jgi:hypothetical protein